MFFNVSQLMREPNGSHRTSEVDEALSLAEEGSSVRVSGRVEMLRTDRGIWVTAALDTAVPCTCSRCLIEFEQPIHMAIEEEYFPLVDVATGTRLDRSDNHANDHEGFFINSNHILDLSDAVTQYSALSTPMKPVCKESCSGICSNCGTDLNLGECTCEDPQTDQRWAALLEYTQTGE